MHAVSFSPSSGGWVSTLRLPALILLGWALACLPVLEWWAARFGDGSDEPLGAVALACALGLLWSQQERLQVSLGGLSMGLLLIAMQVVLPLPMMVKGALAVIGLSVAFSLPTQHAGVAALLLLSLPVVASLQFYLGYPMRWVAAQGTVGLLSLMGIDVMQQGTTLISGGQEVGVDPACSGVKMLWTGLALAGWFSARERLSLGRTGVLMAAAVGAVLIANAVRAAVLFLPESGRVDWPEWTHEGMGLVAFLGVAWGVMASSERLAMAKVRFRERSTAMTWGVMAVGIGGLGLIGLLGARIQAPMPAGIAVEWPHQFEGESLTAKPLSVREEAMAESFPGDVRVFETPSGRTVILRHVTKPTRALHSSSDCLRAAGYRVTAEGGSRDEVGQQWGTYRLAGAAEGQRLRERIVDAEGISFQDPSAWYWQALLGRSRGPWWAMAVIE